MMPVPTLRQAAALALRFAESVAERDCDEAPHGDGEAPECRRCAAEVVADVLVGAMARGR